MQEVNAMKPNSKFPDALDPVDFARRHIGPSPAGVRKMLDTAGVSSIDELIEQTVPSTIRQRAPLDLGPALSETEVLQKLRSIGPTNPVLRSLIVQRSYATLRLTRTQGNN